MLQFMTRRANTRHLTGDCHDRDQVRHTAKTHTGSNPAHLSDKLLAIGTHVTRYGLVVVLLWIGDEVHRLRGRGDLAAGGQQPAHGLGVRLHERRFPALLGSRSLWPHRLRLVADDVGNRQRAGGRDVLTTLTFLFTTAREPSLGGFPACRRWDSSAQGRRPAGASLWTAGECWRPGVLGPLPSSANCTVPISGVTAPRRTSANTAWAFDVTGHADTRTITSSGASLRPTRNAAQFHRLALLPIHQLE